MQKVFTYLRENESKFLADLQEYLRLPSISPQIHHKKDIQAAAHWLVAHCEQIGLSAQLVQTDGNPIVIAKTPRLNTVAKPTYLVYGHYDVMPPEPLELWQSPPFEPQIRGRWIFGRGASDNKGQHFAHFKAVEAYLKTRTELPCNITFVIEGEEETGGANLLKFIEQNHHDLECEAVVVSDTGMPDLSHPAVTYALRGIAALQITVRGPSRDLHSGIFGGSLTNPALAMCKLLADVCDKHGRITIPGFYDDVVDLSPFERTQMARIPFDLKAYRKFLGVPKLFGESDYTPEEQRTARPTFEINGLTSGYQGEGSKTIIPAQSQAKITMRLVPNQKPERITKLVVNHFKKTCPDTVRMEIEIGHGAKPYFIQPEGPIVQAGLRALKFGFDCDPVLIRDGGSIPIVTSFKQILGVDTLLLGLALPQDDAHSPNEKFSLDSFVGGMKMSAQLWQELGLTHQSTNTVVKPRLMQPG